MQIGIIGSGVMAGEHAVAWSTTGHDVVAIHSDDAASGRRLARSCGANFCSSVADLIEAAQVVIVCTPTDTHLGFISLAARAGRDVITEKPLARTSVDAITAVARCEAAGVRLLVAHVVRFYPDYRLVRDEVVQGSVGRIAMVRLKRCSGPPSRTWYREEARSGGIALDLMVHDFDYARWIAGDVVAVFAQSARLRAADHEPVDHVLAVLTHDSGAISHVEGSWGYPDGPLLTSISVDGDRGAMAVDSGASQPLRVIRADRPDAIAVPTTTLDESPFVTQVRHFGDILSGSQEPVITARDAAAAVGISEAVIASMVAGRPRPVPVTGASI
jgi:myo-inositol 2-dehydrogenase / D-chiro-inositol 1-dehydrogenase